MMAVLTPEMLALCLFLLLFVVISIMTWRSFGEAEQVHSQLRAYQQQAEACQDYDALIQLRATVESYAQQYRQHRYLTAHADQVMAVIDERLRDLS